MWRINKKQQLLMSKPSQAAKGAASKKNAKSATDTAFQDKEKLAEQEQSLESLKEELRDNYMNFKDLKKRTAFDIAGSKKENMNVFYMKPQTFLLQKPEKQRLYREDLLKRISKMPTPDPLNCMGNDLYENYIQQVADRSHPTVTKQSLHNYYLRRQYGLQHLKYKLLARWAHNAVCSENIERLSSDATHLQSQIEFNLEQSSKRAERLSCDDWYNEDFQRPKTKSANADGKSSLYIEKTDLPLMSIIRQDDVEVYLRGITYKNKVARTSNKLLSRLKWMALKNRYQIYEKVLINKDELKKTNIQRQQKLIDRTKARILTHSVMTPELKKELQLYVDTSHVSRHNSGFLSSSDKILNNWRDVHDNVPALLGNVQELKLRVLDMGELYGIHGDIELDYGYSYTYQVTVFFPIYFQKQINKAQFSIYDVFAEEERNTMQNPTFNPANRVDVNIQKDMSLSGIDTAYENAINDEAKELGIRVIRLKSSIFWIDYVCLTPFEPDWHKKQQAVLESKTKVDTLLEKALTFLDVNDLASTNQVHEDMAILHQTNMKKFQRENPHEMVEKLKITKADKQVFQTNDISSIVNSQNQAYNLQKHMLQSVQDSTEEQIQTSTMAANIELTKASLRFLPAHLLVSFFQLRHASSRDAKTRILYSLNYFRSIQKRIALDLREFGTRERVDSHMTQPFMFAAETSNSVVRKVNFTEMHKVEKDSSKFMSEEEQTEIQLMAKTRKMTAFSAEQIHDMRNLASLRMYKLNGVFSNRVARTSPSLPKFPIAFGEPTVRETEEVEEENLKRRTITEKSLKLMGRVDTIELDEVKEEVFVKDDFGIFVLFDCVLQDMTALEQQLLLVGSYFIQRSEVLQDPKISQSIPYRDRQQLLDDLLTKEAAFQFRKVKLVQVYMECYEHITDPLEQQRLMQVITDIMARRPRMNLNANYFVDSYDAEIECLEKQFELVKHLVDKQISLEKTENKRLQSSLCASYDMAKKFQQKQWTYKDAETFMINLFQAELKKRANSKSKRQIILRKQASAREKEALQSFAKKTEMGLNAINEEGSATCAPDQKESSDSSGSQKISENNSDKEDSFDEEAYWEPPENQFEKLLGLAKISIENLYTEHSLADVHLIQLMNKEANFVQMHEGFPEFLSQLEGGAKSGTAYFKVNSWSQDTGCLDFYQSLDFITKLYTVMQETSTELCESLKPYDSTVMTLIDTEVAKQALAEYHQICKFTENAHEEYQGRRFVEDESIVGDSEKVIFFAKEMIASLSNQRKLFMNPYLIAKLDFNTVQNFDFLPVEKFQSKYQNLFSDHGWAEKVQTEAIITLAENRRGAFNSVTMEFLQDEQQTDDVNTKRRVKVPSLMHLYSNLVEFLRLRNELIQCASECAILQEIYVEQCKQCSHSNFKAISEDPFDFPKMEESSAVNFCEEGPASHLQIGLAIREYSTELLSNVNFRHPDALKIGMTDAGLEEMRAIFAYQQMQKTLLIVAVRQNSFLIDAHMRTLLEFRLLEKKQIYVPNSMINIQSLLAKGSDGINNKELRNQVSRVKTNISNSARTIFCNLDGWKDKIKSSVCKEFAFYEASCTRQFQGKPNSLSRTLRAFKVKLLHHYCQTTLLDCCLDSQKAQTLQVLSRVRTFSNYFKCDSGSQIFEFETNSLLENTSFAYKDEAEKVDDYFSNGRKDVKVLNSSTPRILNFDGIPSTSTVIQSDACLIEDVRVLRDRIKKIRTAKHGKVPDLQDVLPDVENPEHYIKHMLLTYTPIDFVLGKPKKADDDKQVRPFGQKLEYEEALYFQDSKFNEILSFYQSLERILSLEWFIQKMHLKKHEVVMLDHAMETGMMFWESDGTQKRLENFLPEATVKPGKNQLSQAFFVAQIVSEKNKRNLVEVVSQFGRQIRSILNNFKNLQGRAAYEYLQSYTEFRYMQIVCTLQKLTEDFKLESDLKSVEKALASFSKMDHVKVAYSHTNAFHVNTSLVDPRLMKLEFLSFGAYNEDEHTNFLRCIRPVINEKALEPPQITLFQSLYQIDAFRKKFSHQFAGQLCSTLNRFAFSSLDTALLDLPQKQREFSQSQIYQTMNGVNDFMLYLENDDSFKNTEAYTMTQISDAKRYLMETAQAFLIKKAILCWLENSILPQDPQKLAAIEARYNDLFFWKIRQLREKVQQQDSKLVRASFQRSAELQRKITSYTNNISAATDIEKKANSIALEQANAELDECKRRLVADSYYCTKAQIIVLSNEVEKFLINASIKAMQDETMALAKCFSTNVASIQLYIHPFQQFAATLYETIDRNSHLDITNKVQAIQVMLTKLRNRGTIIDTLTSGPGYVFTIKDFNECVHDFCRQAVRICEMQLKIQMDSWCQKENQYRTLIYMKDQTITNLHQRIERARLNVEKVVDSRMFEKGNGMLFELDNAHRLLALFKQQMMALEQNLVSKIISECKNKFDRNELDLERSAMMFKDFQVDVRNKVAAMLSDEEKKVLEAIEQKRLQAMDLQSSIYQKPNLYPASGSTKFNRPESVQGGVQGRSQFSYTASGPNSMPGALIPPRFQHYTHCSCYVPITGQPHPTVDMAEAEMMSEQQVRYELVRVCEVMRTQRIFYKTKEMLVKQKFMKEQNLMKKQLANNAYLWEELAESEKREKVLKKEMLLSQQSLAANEKVISRLQDEMKNLESERSRLLKFKNSKSVRMQELEKQLLNFTVFEKVDTDKLIKILGNASEENKKLKNDTKNFDAKLEGLHRKSVQENQANRVRFKEETQKADTLKLHLERLQLELKVLENNDTSAAVIWKQKCSELFEQCKETQAQNTVLRLRIEELETHRIESFDKLPQLHMPRTGRAAHNKTSDLGRYSESQIVTTAQTNAMGAKARNRKAFGSVQGKAQTAGKPFAQIDGTLNKPQLLVEDFQNSFNFGKESKHKSGFFSSKFEEGRGSLPQNFEGEGRVMSTLSQQSNGQNTTNGLRQTGHFQMNMISPQTTMSDRQGPNPASKYPKKDIKTILEASKIKTTKRNCDTLKQGESSNMQEPTKNSSRWQSSQKITFSRKKNAAATQTHHNDSLFEQSFPSHFLIDTSRSPEKSAKKPSSFVTSLLAAGQTIGTQNDPKTGYSKPTTAPKSTLGNDSQIFANDRQVTDQSEM